MISQPSRPPRRGQVAIVTGAARGIGAAVAHRLHAEGASLLLVDLDPQVEQAAAALGARAAAHRIDVADPDAWSAVVGERVDVLVNCAGILGPPAPVAELAVADFARVQHVNLTGTFVACRAVLPAMLAVGRGWIVSMASIAGKEGNALQAAYSASKGGVIALTKSLAKEVAARGISVNCVAPTVIEGPFADAMLESQRAEIRAKIPMGRFGRPEEVAATIAWIASAECSFTTGFCFDLTGGRATY